MTRIPQPQIVAGLAALVAILCTRMAAAVAQSEAVIRGQVVAAANGAEVPNATVTLLPLAGGERVQTTADASGRFAFQSVRPGAYVLSTTAAGFATQDRRIVVEPREIAAVTVPLELRGVDVSVHVAADLIASTHSPSSTVLSQERLDTMPVFGGFVTEAAHITATNRFLAPMDQTHTATGGLTWRHAGTGLWIGTMMEYGSGTPIGHGDAAHDHAAGEDDHAHASSSSAARVPAHFTANLSVGADLLRSTRGRSRVSLQIDVENISDRVYVIAQEGEFAPTQFSIPRLISATAKIRF